MFRSVRRLSPMLVTTSRTFATSNALIYPYMGSTSISMFDSKWTKKAQKKQTLKYKGRSREKLPDHDKDMPSNSS